MSRQVVIVGLAVGVVFLVAFALLVKYQRHPGAGTNAGGNNSTVHFVNIVKQNGSNHFAYSPQTITVKVGTKVGWRNFTQVAHSVTSSASPPVFNSGGAPF